MASKKRGERFTENAMQLVSLLGASIIALRFWSHWVDRTREELVQDRLRRKKRLACIRLYQTPGHPTIPSSSQPEISILSKVESYG